MGTPPKTTALDLHRLAGAWLPGAAVRHVRDGENAVFVIETTETSLVLRVTGSNHRTRGMLQAELEFVEYLAACGMRVAAPVPTLAGERVVALGGGDQAQLFASCFRMFEGRHFAYYSDDIDAPLFRQWGRVMGELHAHSRRYRPQGVTSRPNWSQMPLTSLGRPPEQADPFVAQAVEEQRHWLSQRQPEGSAFYGLVHGDFERTNFLLQDGEIGLFDFDDCLYHWHVWDIASALWVFRRADERGTFLRWFLEGYREANTLDEGDIAEFDRWVRLRTLCLVLARLREGRSDAREWIDGCVAWLKSDRQATDWG